MNNIVMATALEDHDNWFMFVNHCMNVEMVTLIYNHRGLYIQYSTYMEQAWGLHWVQLSLPWLFDLHEYALVAKKKAQRWETIPSLASRNQGIILSGWLLSLINNVEVMKHE